ncbi:MAG: hypothetical protein AAF682_21210 [Planctomycetota bacterium]
MKHRRPFAFASAAFALLGPLSGCLENEEVITVRADGSVHVAHSVKGDYADFAEGYSLPLHGPWTPANEEARSWLRHLVADTGSTELREAMKGIDAAHLFGIGDDGLRLSVEADFPSVASWPRYSAPEHEPYFSAYLERTASLEIDDKGDRVVYTFERTYHARRYEGFDLVDRLERVFPEELQTKLDELQPLSAPELSRVAAIVRDEHRTLYANFARSAVEMTYTHGSAELSPDAGAAAVLAVESAVTGLLTDDFVGDVWERVRAWAVLPDEERLAVRPSPLEELEERLRDQLRSSVARALTAHGTSEEAVNETLFAVEWNLTDYDHSMDLADEKFRVEVEMPGTIVGGNYASVEEGRAVWTLEIGDLNDRDRTMRVVSVLGG